MAVSKYAKSKMLEILLYFVAFSIYSFLFYFLGFDVSQYESIWSIGVYYLVLNIFAIPTASFFLALIQKHKRKDTEK